MGTSSGRDLLLRGLRTKAGELVTLKTEIFRSYAAQADMFGGVGGVATFTLAFRYRCMCVRRGKGRTAILMAFVTQGAVALIQGKGSGCVGGVVATFAVSLLHRLMSVAF